MPELPEVETIRQDLRKKILNKKIIGVKTTVKARLNKSRAAFARFLIGKKLVDIGRVGKLLIFVLSGKGNYLLVHLKMTGQLIYRRGREVVAGGHSDSGQVELPGNYTRAEFIFADKSVLYFNDLRRFGYLHLVGEKELAEIKSKYGIEPLTKDFTFKNFLSRLQNKKTSIKSALLNQSLFAGIGNIYADESCFLAGIRPAVKVSKLTGVQANKLYRSIESVIRKSINKRGTTFSSYVDSDGRIGGFKKLLNVYGRVGEKCRRCKTVIKKIKLNGRGTHFCPGCQK
ncbi:MAG: bifunctional DNA-formamidopyrimidine glycosylase/DNA-(apurinic or apyrimidinic site) lyase [Candidatus Magasanikbacteria bacterium]|nr:bifunctional DNA-formamidopyrimidine glycosylase/DNA-(apurinic or apyrimidinic site) lyase [Candidatus Magasanikbacteria bacterium]